MLRVSKRHFSERVLQRMPSKWQPYLRLVRFDKPVGTYLTLWPGVWSLTMGAAYSGSVLPPVTLTAVFVCGAFCMRSAGCVVNDMWDREFDARVERTAQRPLASGELSVKQGVLVLGVTSALAASTLFFLNDFAKLVALGAVAPVVIYPAMKRVTWWPQAVLGLTFNWGALLGVAAVTGNLFPSTVLFYLGCAAWTVSYDTLYGHQDKKDDAMLGLKSTALMDDSKGYRIPLVSAVLATALWSSSLALWYESAYGLLASLPAGMYAVWLASSTNTANVADCGKAFRNSQRVGPLMLAGLLTANWVLSFYSSIQSMMLV